MTGIHYIYRNWKNERYGSFLWTKGAGCLLIQVEMERHFKRAYNISKPWNSALFSVHLFLYVIYDHFNKVLQSLRPPFYLICESIVKLYGR